jgi:coatomer subunit beta'
MVKPKNLKLKPLNLKIKKKFLNRSDRVKSVDLHSEKPWILTALYSGKVVISDYSKNTVVKSFDVCDNTAIRCAKFVERMNWIICASDDMKIRVYNYNNIDKIVTFEAHTDYIRDIAVHPTQPIFLTCSDDFTIKMWNWEQKWKLIRTFEGHLHYVMHVCFNPKDLTTFASASLDHTVKCWSLNKSTANFTLEGHTNGVNYVSYYHGSDKSFLISGSDDK